MVTKKNLFFLGVIIVCLVGIGLVISTNGSLPHEVNGHSADDVLIMVGEYTMTLQEAIIGGFLVDGSLPPSANNTTSLIHGGDANEILVSVKGVGKSLQQAIGEGGLCSSTDYGLYISGTISIAVGHSADEISIISQIDGNKTTLQDAINRGEFCCVHSCAGGVCNDGCGGACPSQCAIGQSCGNDVCGRSCGSCPVYWDCVSGVCKEKTWKLLGRVYARSSRPDNPSYTTILNNRCNVKSGTSCWDISLGYVCYANIATACYTYDSWGSCESQSIWGDQYQCSY